MAQMTFFLQFGLFIGITIILSALHALVYLICLLATIGPQGSRANGTQHINRSF
jgi:hypothetical protein